MTNYFISYSCYRISSDTELTGNYCLERLMPIVGRQDIRDLQEQIQASLDAKYKGKYRAVRIINWQRFEDPVVPKESNSRFEDL